MLRKTIVSMFLLTVVLSLTTQAQDVIIKTNKDSIHCKIKEVLHDEIKYTLPKIRQNLLFGIDKNEVKQLVFENGEIINIEHSMYGSANYENQKKRAIKFNFLAPITGNTTFSYEQLQKPTRSWEASLGIIGLGFNTWDEEPRGAFAKFGLKFMKDPDFYSKGMRYAHVLKGTYFKPELAMSIYSFNEDLYYWDYYDSYSGKESRKTNYVAALNLILGNQWIFNDKFLIDFYAGVGYGFGEVHDYRAYHFGFSGADGDTPLTLTAGFKVGLLLK